MSAKLPKTVYTISNRRDAFAGCVRHVSTHSPQSLIFAFRQRRDAVALRPYFSAPFRVEPHGRLMFIVKRLPSQAAEAGHGRGQGLEVCNTGTLDALARAYLNNTRLLVIDHVRESLDKSSARMVARFEIEDVEFDDSLRARHLTAILDSTIALDEGGS